MGLVSNVDHRRGVFTRRSRKERCPQQAMAVTPGVESEADQCIISREIQDGCICACMLDQTASPPSSPPNHPLSKTIWIPGPPHFLCQPPLLLKQRKRIIFNLMHVPMVHGSSPRRSRRLELQNTAPLSPSHHPIIRQTLHVSGGDGDEPLADTDPRTLRSVCAV